MTTDVVRSRGITTAIASVADVRIVVRDFSLQRHHQPYRAVDSVCFAQDSGNAAD